MESFTITQELMFNIAGGAFGFLVATLILMPIKAAIKRLEIRVFGPLPAKPARKA